MWRHGRVSALVVANQQRNNMKTAIELAREIGFSSAVILWIYSGKESALCESEVKELRNIERLVEAAVAQERKECIHAAEVAASLLDDPIAAIKARNNP